MKRVLNFFSKPDEELKPPRTTYTSREPTLNRQPPAPSRSNPSGGKQFARAERPASPSPSSSKTEQMPTDYAGIVEFFQKKVRDRKSPYNGLVSAADCLKEFIPDETSRLKAVLAVCGDRWPLETLSLAINTHISDIEAARSKARDDTHAQASERAAGFRQQAGHLKEQNEKIENEIRLLNESIQKLEAGLNANKSKLASLNEQIQLADAHANSVSFVDQAAENLKNDLQAKKIILGLP